MDVVQAVGISKRYPGSSAWALKDANLVIRSGDVFGLVGENGAGKTTLLRVLLGLLRPSAGRLVFPPGLRLGYVSELPTFWPTLTVREQLSAVGHCAGMFGRRLADAIDRMLRLTDLTSKQHARTYALSRGMLQRLGIAQAALPDPQLLVLDEPTSGLDPVGQRDIRNLVRALHREGKTILISSHYLVELEEACTRVGVLQKGKLVLDAAMADLIQANRHRVQMDLDGAPAGLAAELAGLGITCEADGNRLSFVGLDDERYFTVMTALQRHRLRILSLGHPGLLLEQVFLETAGRAAR